MAGRHNAGSQYFFPASLDKFSDEKADFKSFDSENNQSTLQKILLNRAETCEEKFKVLDARDKLYKLLQYKYPSVKKEALSATCPDMCPEKERLLREYQNRGSIFEMNQFSRTQGFNHGLAVKEYARSSADQEEPLPHELRPISVLTMTMSHLLHNVADYCELSDDNLEEWYMFMWDRTRALRKELTQQGVCCPESVTIVEQCARFHIHCAERLVDQDCAIYDDKINTENLTKCLQTLKYMYKDLAKEDVKCPNEPEFVCYALLLNLNNSSVFTELSHMSPALMTSQPVKFALDVMTTWETRNYIRFFDLLKKTTYLNCCLLRRYFGEMRLYAIKTMIRSYCTKNYSPQIPISRFVQNLNFEGEEECLSFLAECNFNFLEVNGMTVVNFNRLLFQNPQSTLTTGRAYVFIEEKKTRPLSAVLAGGTLPPKLYENHTPENSFTENGDLKDSVLSKFDLLDVPTASSATSLPGLFDNKPEKQSSLVSGIGINPAGRAAEKSMSSNIFQKDKPNEFFIPETAGIFQKYEKPVFSGSSLFPQKESTSSANIFASVFNKKDNSGTVTFGSDSSQNPPKSIFDKKPVDRQLEPTVFLSKNSFQSGSSGFGEGPKPIQPFSGFHFGKNSGETEESGKSPVSPPGMSQTKSTSFASFKFQSSEPVTTAEEEKEKMEKALEEEQQRRRREEEEEEERERRRIKEIEEEERRKKVLEENRRAEIEKRQREKREREERLKLEEEKARLEKEERRRRKAKEELEKKREEEARLRRLEESKRQEELEYRLKVDRKMNEIRREWQKWKTKIFFDKWRIKTWTSIEGRKMRKYLEEVRAKYPPVCSEELLNSNPYGLVIPNTLVFEKFRTWRREFQYQNLSRREKLVIIKNELPLLKINSILCRSLEGRGKRWDCKSDSFPWKLVISVPDAGECPEFSRSIETFIEMHFVHDVRWEFGTQTGPLYCQKATYNSFPFTVSIRRVRGTALYEGSQPDPAAVEGSNSILFVLYGTGNAETRARLKAVVKARRSLPKVPVILFSLTDDSNEERDLKKFLDVDTLQNSHVGECHVVPVVNGRHDLVGRLVESLDLAASISCSPPSLRLSHLSEFFTETRLDSLWRRIGIGLSNFKIVLDEPKILIEYYNSCIDHLGGIFLESSYDRETVLGDEFSEAGTRRPDRSAAYRQKLERAMEGMRLPHWPLEIPKSCHQLNYRIHQYCKKVVGSDRLKLKNLKWLLYRIIRRSLLWKGLDIYCDEDIRDILVHFPWISVFQEISRVLTQRLKESAENEKLVVIYDADKIAECAFQSSLISKLLKRTKKLRSRVRGEEEFEDENESPCPENDSVIFAYSLALERETNKRKREETVEDGLDELFANPSEKRLILEGAEDEKGVDKRARKGEEEDESDARRMTDLSVMEMNLKTLDDRLEQLKKRTLQNESILTQLQCQFE